MKQLKNFVISGSPLPKIGGPFVEKSRNNLNQKSLRTRSKGIENLVSTELMSGQSLDKSKKPKISSRDQSYLM